jgi:transposase
MGRAVAELGILAGDQIPEGPSMSKSFDPRMPTTTYDHTITIVAVLELSGKSWLFGAVAPGVDRRTKRSIDARDIEGVMKALEQLKIEARKAGFEVGRVVLGYEAGRDGFWIARALQTRGLEVYVMHPSSISVERRGRRAKSDRLDVDILLGTLLGWLRGEPRRCTMAPIPTEAEEDMREPGRRREAIVAARLKVENQIDALLVRYGVESFKPRLKNAEQKLAELKTAEGRELPPNTMGSVRRLLAQHRLLSQQLKEIEAARQQVATKVDPDPVERKIQLLSSIFGLGVETATVLAQEVFARCFKDRRALAAFVGVSGTPYDSGGSRREQGLSKNGNSCVRRLLGQLAWRWLKFQPESGLARWFHQRVNGAKGRIKKIMIVALARKLLVALWRFVETGEIPEGVRFAA